MGCFSYVATGASDWFNTTTGGGPYFDGYLCFFSAFNMGTMGKSNKGTVPSRCDRMWTYGTLRCLATPTHTVTVAHSLCGGDVSEAKTELWISTHTG